MDPMGEFHVQLRWESATQKKMPIPWPLGTGSCLVVDAMIFVHADVVPYDEPMQVL